MTVFSYLQVQDLVLVHMRISNSIMTTRYSIRKMMTRNVTKWLLTLKTTRSMSRLFLQLFRNLPSLLQITAKKRCQRAATRSYNSDNRFDLVVQQNFLRQYGCLQLLLEFLHLHCRSGSHLHLNSLTRRMVRE